MYIAMKVMRLEDTEPFERSFYREKRIGLVKGRVQRAETELDRPHRSQHVDVEIVDEARFIQAVEGHDVLPLE
jgi:hypothetical protein